MRHRETAKKATLVPVGEIKPPERGVNKVEIPPNSEMTIGSGRHHGNYFIVHNANDHEISVFAGNWHDAAKFVEVKIAPHDTLLVRGFDESKFKNPSATVTAKAEYFSVANWGELDVMVPERTSS